MSAGGLVSVSQVVGCLFGKPPGDSGLLMPERVEQQRSVEQPLVVASLEQIQQRSLRGLLPELQLLANDEGLHGYLFTLGLTMPAITSITR